MLGSPDLLQHYSGFLTQASGMSCDMLKVAKIAHRNRQFSHFIALHQATAKKKKRERMMRRYITVYIIYSAITKST